MDRFTYEAELTPSDGGYHVEFPELDGAVTFGDNIEEAIAYSAEVLELIVAEYLDEGRQLPDPVFRGYSDDVFRVAVSVEVTPETIERMKCWTITQAAEELGVTKSRISQMIDAGILKAVAFGNDRLVTIESVNKRKKNPRGAGRPKKEAI